MRQTGGGARPIITSGRRDPRTTRQRGGKPLRSPVIKGAGKKLLLAQDMTATIRVETSDGIRLPGVVVDGIHHVRIEGGAVGGEEDRELVPMFDIGYEHNGIRDAGVLDNL